MERVEFRKVMHWSVERRVRGDFSYVEEVELLIYLDEMKCY
jgi:hypothetical protein